MLMNTTCTLCSIELPRNPILDGDHAYCCSGCHAVFNILSNKQQLSNYQEHPLFQQAVRSGLISNPQLLEKIRLSQPVFDPLEMERLHFEILDMWCPSCAEIIKLFLLQQKGVKNCVIDYSTDLASIEWSPRYITKKSILDLIASLGYTPQLFQDNEQKILSSDLFMRFIVAAFCSVNVMMLAYPLYATYFDESGSDYGRLFAWLSLFVSLPVLFYSAKPIFKRFLLSLKVGLFGMESLIVLGVSTAFGLSLYDLLNDGTKVYFDSMTVIIVFVLLGKIIESKAKFSAKESLFKLVRALPRRGRKKKADGTFEFVSIKEINVSDLVQALSGEKIVLDGVITKGEGLFDESLITGESVPVIKKVGDSLYSGSILQNGSVVYEVKAKIEDSTLQKILGMLQDDLGTKAKYIRSADSVVKWFVPTVVLIAALTGIWVYFFQNPTGTLEDPLIRAISILLISCPCAIGIAAPLAESQILSGIAALGAIVRNRGCLSQLGKETVFVFDKTGTVTEGKFIVQEGLDTLPESEKAILKTLTSHSNHLVARSIFEALETPPKPLETIKEIIGKGLMGLNNQDTYLLGSKTFIQEHTNLNSLEIEETDEILSYTYFVKNNECLSVIKLGDQVRDGVVELIQSFKSTTILLSGDSELTVKKVANLCGFKEYYSNHNPLQKQKLISDLREQGHIVCMIGDGINDAPSLTKANIGISVISATDISIQVSDLLLTTDKLQILPKIKDLAIKGRKIIKQNLFWAFFYNIIGVGLAIFGLLSPIFAAFAMVASSLMVLFNAKRIK